MKFTPLLMRTTWLAVYASPVSTMKDREDPGTDMERALAVVVLYLSPLCPEVPEVPEVPVVPAVPLVPLITYEIADL